MTTPDTQADGFTALGLEARLVATLSGLGYEEPTDIQREAIPPLLEGRDLLGQAATGTGKTAAFALPLLQRFLVEGGRRKPAALILVPTRELAIQVAEAVHRYGREIGVTVLPIYGGQAMEQQLRGLRRGVDVVVGTPGRILDHLRRGTLKLETVGEVVLDEADEMLDMGFAEDLEAILRATPEHRQTALFSATMPPRIAQIAAQHLKNPMRIAIARERVAPGELPRVRQLAYITRRAYKAPTLGRVLDMENPAAAIVFCRTRTEVDELAGSLNGHGFRAEALHGGMSQDQRDRVMGRFRAGTAELLIATDVAARGLDVEHVTHVVNYDVPASPEAYVHRIGRTGRAGRAGVAITLVEPREHRLLRNIEQLIRSRIEVATVPTLADLRARRLELVRASLREALLGGGLERYREVVESLGDEFDVMDIAAAAVKLVHQAAGADDDEEDLAGRQPGRKAERTPELERHARSSEPERGEGAGSSRPATVRRKGAGSSLPEGDEGKGADSRRPEGGRGKGAGSSRRSSEGRPHQGGRSSSDVVRIYLNVGRQSGIQPGDLVGYLVKGAGVDGRLIGTIEIGDRHALVEVPAEIADSLIGLLREVPLRGKKVNVRRFREP